MIKVVSICVFIILSCKTIYGVVFTGTCNMEKLLKTQAYVIEQIESSLRFPSTGSKEKEYVYSYLKKIIQEHHIAAKNPEHYLGNPINAFTLITRLARDLTFVEQSFLNQTTYRRDESLYYPSKDDVSGATESLLRIHMMYGLKIPHLANGTIFTDVNKYKNQYVEHVSPMTASDCYELGNFKYSLKDDHPRRNVPWLEEAYRLHKTEHYFYPFQPSKLVERIAEIYNSTGDKENALYWLEERLALTPGDVKVSKVVQYLKQTMKKLGTTEEELKKPPSNFDNLINSELIKVCKGDGVVKTKHRLSCYYSHGPHPFLKLAPFKTELLYTDPDILLFYDVMSDAEIERVKFLTKNTLRHSRVVAGDNTVKTRFDIRSSDVARLPENDDGEVALSRRIEQFTGLHVNFESSELLQIANYGIGGHYAPHCDFYKDFTDQTPRTGRIKRVFWQRAATVLIYMSDVDQGGATAFTKLGLAVFPVKNAALVWMNVDPWGAGDHNTEHTACPVLRGAKWVASKWILMLPP